jgi:putative mycofactocin binding protein MftB
VIDASESAFDARAAWHLSPLVSLRDEEFGAMAYHHGNRRLVFLKSRKLVEVVRELHEHESADAAIDALVGADEHSQYVVALASLAKSEVLCVG